jgi:hypothetical protein
MENNDASSKKPTTIVTFSFKENQLDTQFIFSTFRQTPLHVSGVSIAHHQDVHHMDTEDKLCIKLVFFKRIYRDARTTTHKLFYYDLLISVGSIP